MPGRQEESASAQLGALLLRGYTMLAEACPDCNIPLMRDPQTLQSRCVSCQHTFLPADLQASSSQLAAGAASGQDNSDVNATAEPASVHNASASPSIRPSWQTNGPIASPSSIRSGSHADLTAAGPAAAAAETTAAAFQQQQLQQGTPTGRSLQQPGGNASDGEIMQAYREMRASRQQQERQEQERAGRSGQQGTPDVAQLLADRMLTGWALLGDHCPICSTPLMRNRRDGEVRCVACDLPVRLQGTITSPSGNAAATPAAAAAAVAAGAANASAPARVTARTDQVVQDTADVQQSEGAAMPSAAAAAICAKHEVLEDLQHALLTKLQEARQLLLATPASQAEQLGQHLQLVQQLLQTLEAVKL